jgi:hypothetical protein
MKTYYVTDLKFVVDEIGRRKDVIWEGKFVVEGYGCRGLRGIFLLRGGVKASFVFD